MQHLQPMPVAYIVAMMTTDELIDLNLSGTSPDTSVLRMREVKSSDIFQVSLIGSAIGFGIIVVLAALTMLIGYITGAGTDFFRTVGESVAAPVILAIIILSLIVIPAARLKREAREGYLKIDEDRIDFWTFGGVRVIPMERVFAAAVVKNGWSIDVLRIYFLEDNARKFARIDKTFKNYEAVAGPVMNAALGNENGNDVARELIIRNYNKRASKKLKFATLPPFQFESVLRRAKNILFGEVVEVRRFECDGNTIVYATQKGRYEIPVHTVKDYKVHKVQSKYGVTKWTVTLDLDISSGYEKVVVNIKDIPNAQEIENYLRCLPLLFPVPKEDGYWN